MGKIENIQNTAGSLRDENKNLNSELGKVNARIDKINSQLENLRRSGVSASDNRITKLTREQEAAGRLKAGLLDSVNNNRDALLDFAGLLNVEFNPKEDIGELSDNYPFLMFPLRLETRFKKSGNRNELWLRVYPDDCNVAKNEPLLTEDELESAKIFWDEMEKAEGDETKERGAWRVLVNSYGANRSAWIIKQFNPLSGNTQQGDENEITTSQSSWNEAPQAFCLPDRFVAVTYSDSNPRIHIFKNSVKEYLPVGLDPSLENDAITKDNEGIQLNEDLKWMVDFDAAVEAGMADKIELDAKESLDGFEKIYVVGFRLSSNAGRSLKELEELFEAHKYDDTGFEFIKQGTPTNNTGSEPSGLSTEEDSDVSFNRIFKGSENFTITEYSYEVSDGQKLADALSLDPEIFQDVANAGAFDQAESIAMNNVLFPATLGYFMEEMMDPLFSENDIRETKEFFCNYVSGRGPLPAIKIGKQPYGILPVTNFSKLDFGKRVYETKLYSLIKRMDEVWDKLSSETSWVGKPGKDPLQVLMDVIGLHPNSVEFHQRYSQSIDQLYNQVRLILGGAALAGVLTNIIANRGKQILSELGQNPEIKPPILNKFFLSNPNLLSGPMVDDVPNSETKPIRSYTVDDKNYIEWLRSANANKIRIEDFGGNEAPQSLLYMLLRHSVLLSQADAATGLMIRSNLIKNKREYYDPPFLSIQENEYGRSKFEHLFQVNEAVTSDKNITIAEYIYQPSVLAEYFETDSLKDVLIALEKLESLPTARLERLLIEHLDCCSYRLDSWKTALVYHKLKAEKYNVAGQQLEKGIYLGAYGWLFDLRPKTNTLEKKLLSPEQAEFFAPGGEEIMSDPANLGYIHAHSIDQAATAAILRNAYDSNKDSAGDNPFSINLNSERVKIANDFLEGMRNGQYLSALLGYQFERGLHDRYESSNIEADKFIYPLRMQFPLVADNLKSTRTTEEDMAEAEESNNISDAGISSVEARNVIDGLKLINHVLESGHKEYPFGKSKLPAATPAEKKAIEEEVARLIDINDSIGDLVIAEQVYQAVKGNYDRIAGVADSFSKGSHPPEMEVIQTPRTGITLNNKIAIHFNSEASASVSPNSVDAMTGRAKLEPAVNEWLSQKLPDPDNVRVKVLVKEPGEPEVERLVSQKDLGLQSIDLLYSASFEDEQSMTEMDDRVVNFVMAKYSLNPFSEISILYSEAPDSADKTKVGFLELAALIVSLRSIFIDRKFVSHNTLQLSSQRTDDTDIAYDINELRTRVDSLRTDLGAIQTSLKTQIVSQLSMKAIFRKHLTNLNITENDDSPILMMESELSDFLKEYFISETTEEKNKVIDKYRELLEEVGVADVDKIAAVSDFALLLEDYSNDFVNLPDVIRNCFDIMKSAAYYDSNLSGTGFIHQTAGELYNKVLERVNQVVERWEGKQADYDAIMTEITGAVTDEEKISILKRAFRKVSAELILETPADANIFMNEVAAQKDAFDMALLGLKSIETHGYTDVWSFVIYANSKLREISNYDIISYDPDNEKNQLYDELQLLINLKEEIFDAYENMESYISKKLQSYDDEIVNADTLTDNFEKVELLIQLAKQLTTSEAVILPHLNLSGDFANHFSSAYNKSDEIQEFSKTNENREFPVEEWFGGVARVRENVWNLENIVSLVQGFRSDVEFDLNPLQFPVRDNGRWLALKFIADSENEEEIIDSIRGDSLLYTTHFATTPNHSASVCGIVVDEWTEVIPSREETTGISFHYDQPNSEPPQTMLLITSPENSGHWDWDNIIGALDETINMARKRAVEPAMIDRTNYAQFLPATVMAVTTHPIMISLNLLYNNYIVNKE